MKMKKIIHVPELFRLAYYESCASTIRNNAGDSGYDKNGRSVNAKIELETFQEFLLKHFEFGSNSFLLTPTRCYEVENSELIRTVHTVLIDFPDSFVSKDLSFRSSNFTQYFKHCVFISFNRLAITKVFPYTI